MTQHRTLPPAGYTLRMPVVGIALAFLALIPAAAASEVGESRPVTASAEMSISPAADTYVRSGAPETNEGGSTFLRLRASGDNRALVRFDQEEIADAVGGGTLVSATLSLGISTNGNNWGESGRTVSAYRLTSAWAEGNGFVDQGSPPSRGHGAGATWACASDSDISDQGTDCSGQTEWEMGKPSQPELHPWVEPATATALIQNGQTGSVLFDITSDVADFLSGTPNNGWILKKDIEGQAGLIEFGSRHTANGPQLLLVVESGDQAPPLVEPVSLPLLDPPGEYTNGQATYTIELLAEDLDAGVARVSVERVESEVAVASADCTAACPESFAPTLSVQSSQLGEGAHELFARAEDGAGNEGASEPWTVYIDRAPPAGVSDLRLVGYDASSEVATIGWDEGTGDPLLSDGSPGSGVFQFEVRVLRQGGDWVIDYTDVPDYDLEAASLGEIVDVEVRAIDGVGNTGSPVTATLTVFDAGEYVPWYSDPQEDPGTVVTLTAEQRQQAIDDVLSDPRIEALLAGREVSVDGVLPWSWQGTQATVFGAQVTLAIDPASTFESDWPVLEWSSDLTSYTSNLVHFQATGVTKLLALVRFDDGLVSFQPYDGEIDPASVSLVTTFRVARGQSSTSAAAPPSRPPSEEGKEDKRNALNVRVLDRWLVPEVTPDRFWNWDFRSKKYPLSRREAAEEADWPIALVFRENATVDEAKSLWGGRRLAGPMIGWVHDRRPHPGGHTAPLVMVDDEDKGAYTGFVCGSKRHFRVYAPAPGEDGLDRMFNVRWGFYVIGSAHEDIAECLSYLKYESPLIWLAAKSMKVHGCTECAVEEIAKASRQRGWPTDDNLVDFRNRDIRGRVGSRWHVNDGFATIVCIEGSRQCFGE